MKIQRMTEAVTDEVAKLEQQVFSQPWSRQGFLDTLAMDNVIFLTAMDGERLAGYCGVYLSIDEGEITHVAVAPEYRRRGIARQLVQELIRQAQEVGISRFLLEVRVSNEGAIALYRELGFTDGGIRRNFYEFPREDALVMIRQ